MVRQKVPGKVHIRLHYKRFLVVGLHSDGCANWSEWKQAWFAEIVGLNWTPHFITKSAYSDSDLMRYLKKERFARGENAAHAT